MKYPVFLFACFCLYSCLRPHPGEPGVPAQPMPQYKVWGSKPVYTPIGTAKKVLYTPGKQLMQAPGNIYAFGHFIFQVDVGRGIHIIDNSVPANADRIGFITMNGCGQISIKGNYLYTNSYADLVTLDISDPVNMKEVSRVSYAFPEYTYNYPLVEPAEPGYYICPLLDSGSVVTGWIKDSIYASCYKN